MKTILEQVRTAIRDSDKSRYRMALDTGISQSRLSKLMNGVEGLSVEALEQLADYLGFHVVLQPKPQQKGK